MYYPDKIVLVVCHTVNYVYYPDKTGLVVCRTVNYVYYPNKTGLVVCRTVKCHQGHASHVQVRVLQGLQELACTKYRPCYMLC